MKVFNIFQGTRDEWLVVIYIMAGMYLFGGIFYAIFGSSKLQPWAADVKEVEDSDKK